ncbi:TlpA family protein disulfide reductase [bacterium]|nr:TlpA family protein disulfide reductase [bacterium]
MSPEFTLKNCEGKKCVLSGFEGKVVVISFFGTWSEQCGYYVSCLEEIYSTFRDNDLVVVAITAESDCEVVKKYCDEKGITFPVLVGGREVFRQYKTGGIPDILCVDTHGIVRYRTVGYKPGTEDDLKTVVMILMEEIDLFTLK